jgi:hypothetical protein
MLAFVVLFFSILGALLVAWGIRYLVTGKV